MSALSVTTNGRNKYLTILDNAWQEHLKERSLDAPTVISLFAGCGGSSLGYSMAGFRELLAVEWDDNAVETFKLNFPGIPVYHGDIAKLSVEQVIEMTGLQPEELDILDGSPPCQGFSTAGKRILEDDRNQLFREYVRILRGLMPKVFVMENVSGMVKGKMKLVFAEIMRDLNASGYKVSARLLNAMYFNVPQSRQRMIFVGVREDLGILPSHPGAQSSPIIVRLAFAGITDKGDAPELTPRYCEYWIRAGQGGTVGKQDCVTRLHENRVALTLQKSEGNGAPYHPTECRAISTLERKRLTSFPDNFKFTGRKSATERIGNSVPPLFMRAIAEHIRKKILNTL